MAENTTKLVGQNYQTPDLVAKVTGKAKYAEDFKVDGMLFAKLLTSPMPHCRVKRLDTSAAMAIPGVKAILTADEVPDVRRLRVVTRVNGELRQDGSLAELIFDIPTLIETLSQVMTLEPGDLIATGTPSGVGTSKGLMKPGDVYEVTIEGIGTLRNRIVGVHGEVA